MKIELMGAPRVIMDNPASRHCYFAWPTIARLRNGKLAVAASGYRLTHVCPFGKGVLSFSENEGETWTLPMVVVDTVMDNRDAGVLPFGESGVFYHSIISSLDFNRSWLKRDFVHVADHWLKNATPDVDYRVAYLDLITPEQEQAALGDCYRISLDNGVTFGPVHLSPISSPHGPAEMPDGTLLWVGSVREENRHQVTAPEQVQAFAVDPTTGDMAYLGSVPDIPDPDAEGQMLASYEPYAIRLPDGRILCHIRVQRPGGAPMFTLYQTESDDGGRTWTDPHPLLHPHGGAPSHIIRHSSGALIAAYSNRLLGKPGIRVMFSADGGESWDTDHILFESDFGEDLGYPATVELTDGSLLTVFYAHTGEEEPAVILQQKWKLNFTVTN